MISRDAIAASLSDYETLIGELPLIRRQFSVADNVNYCFVGIRRSGKSYLMYQRYRDLLERGVSPDEMLYVSFEDERINGITAQELNLLLEVKLEMTGGVKVKYAFLDEIQNIDEWFLFVNRLLRTGMHILITGSNAKLLSGELATHLTGRHMKIELYPFSFNEYCMAQNISTTHGTTKEKGLIRAVFDSYLNEGGFPELLYEKRKQSYINTLVDSILKKDIEQRYSILYKTSFENIVQHLLNNSPTKLNYKEMKELFGLRSDHTAENYINYAKNAYLISGLKKFSYKSRERVRDEKVYAIDVAFMSNRENAMEGENLGWRLETIIYTELLKRYRPQECDIYYYEEASGEADFIVCRGKSVIQIIQVSYDISSPKTLKRELKGLLLASKNTGCNNLLLITNSDEKDIVKDGKTINVVPAYAWLLEFQAY